MFGCFCLAVVVSVKRNAVLCIIELVVVPLNHLNSSRRLSSCDHNCYIDDHIDVFFILAIHVDALHFLYPF